MLRHHIVDLPHQEGDCQGQLVSTHHHDLSFLKHGNPDDQRTVVLVLG